VRSTVLRSLSVWLAVVCLGAAALGAKVTHGSGRVTDSSGDKIGDFTTEGNGEFLDFNDDPSQSHPPDRDTHLSHSVPDVGDPYTDVTNPGTPPYVYDIVITEINPATTTPDGWKRR
jgi:hypothetical protein